MPMKNQIEIMLLPSGLKARISLRTLAGAKALLFHFLER
jgi:hypothetical protein